MKSPIFPWFSYGFSYGQLALVNGGPVRKWPLISSFSTLQRRPVLRFSHHAPECGQITIDLVRSATAATVTSQRCLKTGINVIAYSYGQSPSLKNGFNHSDVKAANFSMFCTFFFDFAGPNIFGPNKGPQNASDSGPLCLVWYHQFDGLCIWLINKKYHHYLDYMDFLWLTLW